jgi:nitrate reductase gamma subunit
MNTTLRIIAAISLMAVLFFCVFGFLASNEFTEASKRLPQQIVYGAIGVACLFGAFLLLCRRRQRPRRATKKP